MPPVTILSPYSGRPVKVREHDLGRAIRDEQGRVFYVVEDPEHGRYAARTRKGSQKDLERYREIESGVAKLEGDMQLDEETSAPVYDATGSKRSNPLGKLVILVILLAVAALAFIYFTNPGLIGLGSPDSDESETNADAEQSEASGIEPAIVPVTTAVKGNTTSPGIAAAPPPTHQPSTRPMAHDFLPDGMGNDPEPVIVDASTPPRTEEPVFPAPRRTIEHKPVRTVPIALPTPGPSIQPRQNNFDDFHHTASGLRYKITHLTDGVSARAGNYLTVRYTAQTLDGKPLINDASQSFILAKGEAIRAFDEGLAGIREGEQLRMLVPKGHSNSGALPGIERVPNEPFLLDVQLVTVRPGVTMVIEAPGDIDSRRTTPGDTIDLHYIARVEGRDEVIDATIHRGKPMRITLGSNEVIKGLELGITGMRPGESRQLTIPPYLAYGKYSVAGGLIPENAVLNFRVTLVGIVEDGE